MEDCVQLLETLEIFVDDKEHIFLRGRSQHLKRCIYLIIVSHSTCYLKNPFQHIRVFMVFGKLLLPIINGKTITAKLTLIIFFLHMHSFISKSLDVLRVQVNYHSTSEALRYW